MKKSVRCIDQICENPTTLSKIINLETSFWYDSLIKLQNDLTIDSIKSIRDCHESIIQSEDSSVEGTRARKAKSGYLASAIEEPREGLRSKLIELKKRSMDETRSFKDEATCRKALELSFDEVLTYARSAGEEIIFLTTLTHFIRNYQKSIKMEETVRTYAYKLVSMNSDQGDWFFEELISLNANQNELLRIISEAAPSFYNHIEVDDIRLTATIYQTLGRLHREWKSYIIPESVTLVQIEESTQLVDAIISLAHNQPLHQIGQHLSACLKTGEPDEAGQVQTALQITQHLQDQFNQLISSDLPGPNSLDYGPIQSNNGGP